MLAFLARRLTFALGLLFAVSMICFVLIHAQPGDYASQAKAMAMAMAQMGMGEDQAERRAEKTDEHSFRTENHEHAVARRAQRPVRSITISPLPTFTRACFSHASRSSGRIAVPGSR